MRRQRVVTVICGLSVAILGAALLSVDPAQAKDSSAQSGGGATAIVLTDAQVAAMSPVDQGRRLDPLRAIANAVGRVGKTTQSDIYSNVGIDANHALVNLYVTDVAKAPRLLAAAKAVDPAIDTKLVRVHSAAYTLTALHSARVGLARRLAAHQLSYQIHAISVAPDGSSLLVNVDNPAKASASVRQPQAQLAGSTVNDVVGGVPLSFSQGRQPKTRSWADSKWHDGSPFIAGDVLTGQFQGKQGYCSAGLPAVRKSDNHPIMVTAGHCFPTGTAVYTGAGTPGSYVYGPLGNWVGTVTSYNGHWDAETIDGTDNNSDESDTNGWIAVTSAAYSYEGDYVCHDGARSFFLGHGTVCNIRVYNADLNTYTMCDWNTCHEARGVDAAAVNFGWGSAEGDSGGMVFAITGNTRQARGIVSSCNNHFTSCPDGDPDVVWTEAPDILNAFGLKMNPTT